MIGMTPALLATYEAIQNFTEQRGYPPTIRQLCQILDVNSSATMHTRLQALKKKRLIESEPLSPRTLRILKICPLPQTGEVA